MPEHDSPIPAQRAALRWIHPIEGGYVDDPSDPGGATQYGISLRYLRGKGAAGDIDGDGDIDAADVRALTRTQAEQFFIEDCWHPCRCDEMPAQIAIAVFDHAVNAGTGSAIRLIQEMLRLKVDGIVGPKTLRAIEHADAGELLAYYLARRARYYRDIVAANSSLVRFLDGWLNRLFLLHRYLYEEAV